MMLNENRSLSVSQEERLYNALKDLKISSSELINAFDIMVNITNEYKENHNIDKWSIIIKIRNELPGTDEEKAIFMLGYMFQVFINENNKDE